VRIEDQDLVAQTLVGQLDGFRVLVERHQQAVFRFAFGLIGNREEAQDLSQEAFLAAYANLSSYDPARAAFSTWLLTIARNRCINWLKRHRPQTLQRPDAVEARAPIDPLGRQELSKQLDDALSMLPVDQRSAFVLAEIEELPYAEIARIEQTTLGTVKSRIHRAKQKLQSLLEPVFRELE